MALKWRRVLNRYQIRHLSHFDVATSIGQVRIHHRGSVADRGVLEQHFVNREYDILRFKRGKGLRAMYREMVAQGQKPLIIDAGANIGASLVWFAREYPEAHIIAFEPDAENCALLRQNTKGLDATIHEAAIGSSDGFVNIHDPGEGEWAYRTEPDQSGSCVQLSMLRMVREAIEAGYEPFYVKIDIEGGEAHLFDKNTEWVQEFPIMSVELHDWLIPQGGTAKSFLHCIAALDRDFVIRGENVFSIRN